MELRENFVIAYVDSYVSRDCFVRQRDVGINMLTWADGSGLVGSRLLYEGSYLWGKHTRMNYVVI